MVYLLLSKRSDAVQAWPNQSLPMPGESFIQCRAGMMAPDTTGTSVSSSSHLGNQLVAIFLAMCSLL